MKRTIKLKERELKRMISESVRRAINEAENYGWVVDESEVQEAYEMAVEYMGKEYIDDAIVQSLSDTELAESLAFIFRNTDFEEWYDRNNEEEIYHCNCDPDDSGGVYDRLQGRQAVDVNGDHR